MRYRKKIVVENVPLIKKKLLQWAQQFDEVTWLDSNQYSQKYSSYDAILAVDAFTLIKTDTSDGFNKLIEYQQNTKDWVFGYLTYDLKNDTESLTSKNQDLLDFPGLYFFQPKKIFLLKGNQLELLYLKMVDDETKGDWKEIQKTEIQKEFKIQEKANAIKIRLRMTKDVYKRKVEQLLSHIKRGDIYEANFCQEFFSEQTIIDPLGTYEHLNAISKPPFAAFLKVQNQYVLSASPERYLRKEGTTIISQPIKGTAARSKNTIEDQKLIADLKNDPKERSENIMIVDLVRNDLSKTAIKGSVEVEELCQIHSFEQVHQMISTVVSEVDTTVDPVDIIKTTFPMGSMTGAPKIRAMQLIETLEISKRGLYSGAIGYFTPEGDFDFNVVIRTILYNQKNNYVSYTVGSAITAKSDPDREYEECLLKAKAMRRVLEREI